MENDVELKRKMARTIVYSKRKFNPVIMGLGAALFLLLGGLVGESAWSKGDYGDAAKGISFGLVFAFMIIYLTLAYWIRYKVGPKSIAFVPYFKASRTIYWSDVSKIEIDLFPNKGGEILIFGKDEHPIRIVDSVPGFKELSELVQLHLRAHGKHEAAETFSTLIKQTLATK